MTTTHTLINGLAVVFAFTLAPAAHAGIVYVAINGVDGGTCGSRATPCGSIMQGITNAGPGDHVIVGPGRYVGEPGVSGCACFVAIDKPLVVTSSDGAASTVIDARFRQLDANVRVRVEGSEFGQPGKGFTVTNPDKDQGIGISIEAKNVKIQGNQVVNDPSLSPHGIGIKAISSNAGPMLIAANQVMSWNHGIDAQGDGKTVSKNQVTLNLDGIFVTGNSSATGNIAAGNGAFGIAVGGASSAVGNAVYSNANTGIVAVDGFSGSITRNNIVGNGMASNCGLENDNPGVVIATDNYWGAATGPGPDPADNVCNPAGGSTTTSPVATHPFNVRAPIRP